MKKTSQKPIQVTTSTYWDTWKTVAGEPEKFFSSTTMDNYEAPTKFALVTYAAQLAIGYVLALLVLLIALALSATVRSHPFWVLAGIGIALVALPLFILIRWATLHIAAVILHLCTRIFGASKGYQNSYGVYAYATAPNLFSFIPMAHMIVPIYMFVLLVIGLKKQHKLSTLKSIFAILLPVIILGALGLLTFTLFL